MPFSNEEPPAADEYERAWEENRPSAPVSPFADPKVATFAVPAAFVLGWLLDHAGIGLIPLIFYHELGHGVAAWLCGLWAFPIPIAGFTFVGGKSVFVAAAVAAGLLALLRDAWRRRQGALMAMAAVLLCLQAYLTLGLSEDRAAMWWIYAGSGGEIALPVLAIWLFYQDFPESLRWDFWRYPVLLSAACALVYSFGFWGQARRDPDHRMMGESVASSRESDADWVRLVRSHGWTAQGLADSYAALTRLGLGVVVAQHLLFVLDRRGRVRPTRAPV